MTPPPSPATEQPNAVFDKMCHNQCATCRFIHINFCNLYIQRQDCYFGNFMLDVMRLCLEKEGRKKYGARRAGRKQKLSLFLWPLLGCCQGDKASDPRVCVPFLPSGHFLPRLGAGTSPACGPEKGPLIAAVGESGHHGWELSAQQTSSGHLKGDLCILPEVKDRWAPEPWLDLHWGPAGGTHPFLATL